MGERNHLTDIEAYSKEVLTAMKIDHVPLIPANYSAYFEKNLESKDEETKKAILELMEVEKNTSLDRVIDIEYKVKENCFYIKKILENVSNIYSNTSVMIKLLEDKEEQLDVSQNAVHVKNVVHSLHQNMGGLKNELFSNSKDIKQLYTKSKNIVNYMKENSIYDSRFELFNKAFIEEQISTEIKLIQQFGHSSTILMLRVHEKTLSQIAKEKTKNIVIKSIIKSINSSLRQSDIVGHYGDNIFVILLKHTNKNSAVEVTEKLREQVKKENFFIGKNEIDINIATALLVLSKDFTYNNEIYGFLEESLKEANEYGNENRIIFV
jgi:diguanylate cyclase (GGDEF)-like protein